MQENVKVRQAPGRCPFCRDDLGGKQEVVACASCGARHHAGCHAEHGACASCGGAEALYAKGALRGRVELEPPTGSRIRVRVEGERTELTWHLDPQPWWVVWLLLAPLLPVVLPLWLYSRWKPGPPPAPRDAQGRYVRRITLTPEAMELPLRGSGGTVRLAPSEVGAVSVSAGRFGDTYLLTVDGGLERFVVEGVEPRRGLKAPELEWLGARLRAWKEAHGGGAP